MPISDGGLDFQITSTLRTGPLPAPAELEHYAKISPDLVPHILKTAEASLRHSQELEIGWQLHTIELEKQSAQNNTLLAKSAAALAWLMTIVSQATGLILIYLDQFAFGVALVAVGGLSRAVGTLLSYFRKS